MPLYTKNLLPSTAGFLPTLQTIPGIPLNTLGSGFVQNSTDYITVKGSYEAEMVASINNKNIMVVVPVIPGKIYKPSCDTNGDMHVFFVNDAKATSLIVYDTISGNKTAVAPADATYACIYLTNRGLGAGVYYFRNWQLEEVSTSTSLATPFQPYNLGMKQTKRIQKINDDMSAAGSHAYPYGNIISVKEDVQLWNAQIKVYTAGTFNVIVQEWDNGRIGDPLFDRKMDATVGTFNYSFGGVKLFAGKKYWIGRLSTDPNSTDNVGNAAVGRSTGMPAATFKYVDTLGGASFRSTTVDYPSTYYYFYGLEFQAIGMRTASLVPEKNIFDKATMGFELGSINSADGLSSTNNLLFVVRTKDYIPVKPGISYTYSRIRSDFNWVQPYGYDEKGVYIGRVPYTTSGDAATFTPSSSMKLVRLQFNNVNAAYQISNDEVKLFNDNLQVEPGSIVTELKPYTPVMKSNTKVPEKNLIPRQNLVHGSWQGSPLAINSGSPLYKAIPTPFRLKPGTYTVNSRGDVNAAVLTSAAVLISSTANTPQSFTLSSETDVYLHFRKKDNTSWDVSTFPIDTYELGLQLELGSTATELKPYTELMKPAILYPKKNYFNISGGDIVNKSGTTTGRHYTSYATDNPNRALYYWLTPVKSGGRYTMSWQKPNLSMALWELDKDGIVNFDTGWKNAAYSLTLRSDTVYVMFVVRKLPDPSPTTYYDIIDAGLQFEEGSVATEFENYKSGMKAL